MIGVWVESGTDFMHSIVYSRCASQNFAPFHSYLSTCKTSAIKWVQIAVFARRDIKQTLLNFTINCNQLIASILSAERLHVYMFWWRGDVCFSLSPRPLLEMSERTQPKENGDANINNNWTLVDAVHHTQLPIRTLHASLLFGYIKYEAGNIPSWLNCTQMEQI